MKVLVTGGAGFIGSHIVDELIEKGNDAVVVDNLATGNKKNINPGASFYQVSILDKKLAQVFKLEQPDVVIHEAAQTDVSRSVRDPQYDARTNILGSINVLDNCVKFNVKKVIYASSCAIYGTPQYIPINEAHPLESISPYGVSKQTVEKYLHAYHETFGLDYCALRYSNVYGPRQNSNGEAGVVAIFTNLMLRGQQPKIYGKGDKTRSYVFVDDIVHANMLALECKQTGIFNIGTTEQTTDQRIYDLISGACGYNKAPQYVGERPGEIRHMCLDADKAMTILGWKPATKLEDGILKTVNAYRQEHREEIYSAA
jgi:UDP-glucose 4-epimerase